MTVDELKERMSFQEYRQWQEFAAAEPFPSERVDLAGALVSTVVFNVNRGKSKAAEIEEFMLIKRGLQRLEKSQPKPEQEDLHLINTMLAFGGKLR